MISTTSSTNPTLLGWTGRPDRAKNPSTNTATTKPASTSSSSELSAVKKQLQELTTLLTNLKTNPVAGLSAGMFPPSSIVGMNKFGQNTQGLRITDMASAGTPVSSQQGGAVGSSISTGSELSPSSLLV
jgi:hypothetical protein